MINTVNYHPTFSTAQWVKILQPPSHPQIYKDRQIFVCDKVRRLCENMYINFGAGHLGVEE
jgi:hypothetical protein